MSKTSPDPQVEQFARDAQRNSVVHIYWKRMRAVPRLGSVTVRLRDVLVPGRNIRKASHSFGTGFIIKSNNSGSIVLTADHVIRGMKPAAGDSLYVRIRHPNGGVRQLTAFVRHQHREADVAILSVPALRNAQPLNFAADIGNAGVIAVGFAGPDNLFPDTDMAMKRDPDCSPGCFLRTEGGPILGGVSISHCHLDMVGVKGMSGGPIVNAGGAVGLMSLCDGAYCNAISNDTICQVMKRYYKNHMRWSLPNFTDEDVAAVVNQMTMQEVADEL